jgi:hypothetical protein
MKRIKKRLDRKRYDAEEEETKEEEGGLEKE